MILVKISLLAMLALGGIQHPSTDVLRGRVQNSQGEPVSEAQVQIQNSEIRTISDSTGQFEIDLGSLPSATDRLTLIVTHLTHLPGVTEWVPGQSDRVIVTLSLRKMLAEEVVVTARRPSEGFAPVGAATSTIVPGDLPVPASDLVSLLQASPGIARNGQGGLFQTYSIRGISRQRVITSLSGMRLTSERRAGVSASFFDPFLTQAVDVLRGPSSSYYGSGALGGVADMSPRIFDGTTLALNWNSVGNERVAGFGWGDGPTSIGLSARQADRAKAPNGRVLNSGFTQLSGSLIQEWDHGSEVFRLLIVPTFSENIGKPNTDYPDRTTIYPRERHLLTQFSVNSTSGLKMSIFAHPQDLQTRTTEGDSISEVFNESFDWGGRLGKQLKLNSSTSLQVKADFFRRQGVDATEVVSSLSGLSQSDETRSLEDASEDEVGLAAMLKYQAYRIQMEGGGRFTYLRQRNASETPVDGAAWTGFAGVSVPLFHAIEWGASLGTGLRFPTLGERFFSGTTGRGTVLGNRDLESERSLNLETGIRWFGNGVFASGTYFRNSIDRYIERIEIEPDTLTFVNITNGTIQGIELEGMYSPREDWHIYARGHLMKGIDESEMPLSDIPVHRLTAGAHYDIGRWMLGSELEFRASKENPGSGEKEISSAQLLSGFVRLNLTENLNLELALANLLNEEYFESADRKTDLSPERSILIRIEWLHR